MPTERYSTLHSIILWMFIIGPIALYLVFSRMCFDPKSSKNGIYPMRDECRLICEFCTYFLFQSQHIPLYLCYMHATLPTPYLWALAREPIPNRGSYVVGSPIWAIFHEVRVCTSSLCDNRGFHPFSCDAAWWGERHILHTAAFV